MWGRIAAAAARRGWRGQAHGVGGGAPGLPTGGGGRLGGGPRCFARAAATGLYGKPELTAPEGFHRLAHDAISRSEAMITEIQRGKPSAATVSQLDSISDLVCSVLDAAELCRNTHSDAEFRRAADGAYAEVARYVHTLNNHAPIHTALKEALDAHDARHGPGAPGGGTGGAAGHACQGGGGDPLAACEEGFTQETVRVGRSLQDDFERSGIHLPEGPRHRVGELMGQVQSLGADFQRNINTRSMLGYADVADPRTIAMLPSSVMQMLQPAPKGGGDIRITTEPIVFNSVLKWVGEPGTRESVFRAAQSSPAKNLEVLEQLIDARAELSSTLGYESFAHYTVEPMMARHPDAVVAFLDELGARAAGQAEEELSMLRECKWTTMAAGGGGVGARPGDPSSVDVHAWDRAFLIGISKARECQLDGRQVAAYLPLERCLEGLGELVRTSMGVTMRPGEMAPGETWAPGVRKLDLVHEDEGELGSIYLDLQPRADKFSHNAHFTIRCGRLGPGGEYQKPLVALVCNLSPGPGALLSHSELETLVHEFGHAIHSLLSRTKYQHMSGTRGSLDFVETPSHLMENFAWDERSLRVLTGHRSTGDPMPPGMVAALRKSRSLYSAIDLQSQVVCAALDQRYFGRDPPRGGGGTTRALEEVMARHSVVPHVPGTCQQVRFGHLVGYGASYYSYLYARCFSSAIWREMFEGDPLCRQAGERYWRELLRHGGARDPAELIKGLAGEGAVREVAGGVIPTLGGERGIQDLV